jgi:NAD(P) transhydrogenase subunit alpha
VGAIAGRRVDSTRRYGRAPAGLGSFRERRQPFAEPGSAGRERKAARSVSHGTLLIFEITILIIAIFLGFEVISKVPTLLHTPLMSGTNAIHGIVIVGAMLVAGLGHKDTLTLVVGLVAVVLASANVVGGFVVTDRMLEMFKKREPAAQPPVRDSGPVEGARGNREVPPASTASREESDGSERD